MSIHYSIYATNNNRKKQNTTRFKYLLYKILMQNNVKHKRIKETDENENNFGNKIKMYTTNCLPIKVIYTKQHGIQSLQVVLPVV